MKKKTGLWVAVLVVAAAVLYFVLYVSGEPSGRSEGVLQLRKLRSFGNAFSITEMAWHPGGRLLAVGQVLDPRIAVWDTQTGDLMFTIESERGGVSSMAYSPDGNYLAVGREFSRLTPGGGHVHLYDAGSGSLVRRFPSPSDGVEFYDAENIAFSADSRHFAASGYGTPLSVAVYDVSSGKTCEKTPPLQRGAGTVEAIAYSPCGNFLAIGRNLGSLEIWSMNPWKFLCRLEGQTAGVHALAFSTDGIHLASGTDVGERFDRSVKPSRQLFGQFTDDIVLWSVSEFVKAKEFPSRYFMGVPYSTTIIHLQFFPDSKHLLMGARSDGLEIIDIQNGTVAFYQDVFPGIVHPALSPDGRRIAIGVEENIGVYEIIGI